MNFYAMLDTEVVLFLGKHESYDSADEVSPGNTMWLFSQETLEQLVRSAQAAMTGRTA